MTRRFCVFLAAGVLVLGVGAGLVAAQGAAAAATPPADLNYLIGPGDRLRVTVWNQDNISGEYAVGGDGSFTFPLIGRMVAGGGTVGTLEAELTRRLENGFFKNPQVRVAVIEYRSKRVFLMGAVRTPGTYALVVGEMRLIEALSRAGSTTPEAADHAFIIHSQTASGPRTPDQAKADEMTRIDLRRLSDGDRSIDVVLRDGDTVFVPRVSTAFVYGEVQRPGSYPIGATTTVRQAISLAGGLTEYGADNRIKILRTVDGKETEVRVKLNDAVQPGDTVVVPERMF